MKSKFASILFFVFCAFSVSAQELEVQSFILKTTDLEAKVNPVYDLNKEACALIKVAIVGRDIQFSGNVIGDVENKGGEYYVYMPAGSRRLKISHPDYLPLTVEFSDYDIRLVKNLTYELRIVSPMALGVRPAVQKQFLIMNVSPADATVYIDDIQKTPENGVLVVDLDCGEHTYEVERTLFRKAEGGFEISPEQSTHLTVSLEEASGEISVTSSPVQGAGVYIDEKYEGITPFTSEKMTEGEHTVKVVSEGYDTFTQTVNVISGQTLELEAELSLDSSLIDLQPVPDEKIAEPVAVPVKRAGTQFDKGRFFVGPVVGISPGIKYGGMLGFAKRFGAFVKFKSDFKKVQSEYDCTSDGKTSFGSIWTSGKQQRTAMDFTAGVLVRVAKPVAFYLGGGYGSSPLYWEDSDGKWAKVTDCSYTGAAVSAGMMFTFGPVGISVGSTVTAFKMADLEIGCSIWL